MRGAGSADLTDVADIAEVAVPLPVAVPAPAGAPHASSGFHYRIPPALAGDAQVGRALVVPFGARRLTGYLLARGTAVPPGVALKDVVAFAPGAPLFPEDLVPLYRWLARYYAHPLGDVLRAAVPAATRERRSRAALRVREEELHSLAVDAAEARNAFSHPGPARDRLIDWLARRGEVPAAELKEAFPNAAPALRQLRERGLVRTSARAVDPEAAERGPARAEDREVRAPTAEQAAALAADRKSVV